MTFLLLPYVLVYGFWALGALGVGYVVVMDWVEGRCQRKAPGDQSRGFVSL